MSTEDYKRGVEDALKLMAAHNVQNGYIQPTLEHIRTTLLTKKVTKWVNLYTNPDGGVQTGNRSVYDSYTTALVNSTYPDFGCKHIGAFSVEIDLPL